MNRNLAKFKKTKTTRRCREKLDGLLEGQEQEGRRVRSRHERSVVTGPAPPSSMEISQVPKTAAAASLTLSSGCSATGEDTYRKLSEGRDTVTEY